jgi:hypothetical protein
MTIGELRQALELLDDDMEIRLATQPSYPLQSYLDEEVRVVGGIAYLRESGQVYDAPYAPAAVYGDPIGDCPSCGEHDTSTPCRYR